MNDRDIPSVPITTLSGVASLTGLLPEMPLPTPLPQTLNSKSLLFHPRVAEEARNLLKVRDNVLASQLVQSLSQTSADHIELKDNHDESGARVNTDTPELLKAILERNPAVFHCSQNNVPSTQVWNRNSVVSNNPGLPAQSAHQIPGYIQISPCASRNAPYGSPASPASARLTGLQISNPLFNRPSVITEQIDLNKDVSTNNGNDLINYYDRQKGTSGISVNNGMYNVHSNTNSEHIQRDHHENLRELREQELLKRLCDLNTNNVQEHEQMSDRLTNIRGPSPAQASDAPAAVSVPLFAIEPLVSTRNIPNSSEHQQNKHTMNPTITQDFYQEIPLSASTTTQIHQHSLIPAHQVVEDTRHDGSVHHMHEHQHQALQENQKPPMQELHQRHLHGLQQQSLHDVQQQPVLDHRQHHMQDVQQLPLQELHIQPMHENRQHPVQKLQQQPVHDLQQVHELQEQPVHELQQHFVQELQQHPVHELQQQPVHQLEQQLVHELQQQPVLQLQNVHELEQQPVLELQHQSRHKLLDDPLQDPLMAVDSTQDQNANTRRPIVRINRINEQDQALMLKSISKFAEQSPLIANELGLFNLESSTTLNNEDCDVDFLNDDQLDTFSALKRKRPKYLSDDLKESESLIAVSKPKLRKVERKLVPVIPKLSEDELMETNTYQLFIQSIDRVLESTEDLDSPKDYEDTDFNMDALLPRYQLQVLCNEAAKLKSIEAMGSVPSQRLIRLLNVLDMNIRGGLSVSLLGDPDEDEDMRSMWVETTMDRIMGAVEASLTTMYIMTSKDMPKRIYIEDIIDRVILFIKFQLQNTIYPAFDPTHRIENKKKGTQRKKKNTNSHIRTKGISNFYNRIHELVQLLSELLSMQHLTDNTVLHASSIGVSPFFVENVNELQLSCLKLVTTIFTRYEIHRKILLDDILASMARLPGTKRNLRLYRLETNVSIQMLTALVLHLIQCVVILPDDFATSSEQSNAGTHVDKDAYVCNKYEIARGIAGIFLENFLNKCRSRATETDFRPLFENFVHDLLTTVNKPQWPAAEVLLGLLGTILIKYMSDKNMDVAIRVASLEYLGLITARLRKDAVLSVGKKSRIDTMISDIKMAILKDSEADDAVHVIKDSSVDQSPEDERNQFLQSVLLDFLAVNGQEDMAWSHARHFYLTQWYVDNLHEKKQLASSSKNRARAKKGRNRNKNHRKDADDSSDSEAYSDPEEEINRMMQHSDQSSTSDMHRLLEQRKSFLLSKIHPYTDAVSCSGNKVQVIKTYINEHNAGLISQYLASSRLFSQSFDSFLKQMLFAICEPSIAIRTKVIKCMTMIVEVDPAVLASNVMQKFVAKSLHDTSTSVREAAVDLLGKFMLSQPDIIDQYYEVLTGRILDTGVSVRKRVIKILRDICVECPNYSKNKEICVKMIRRVNDEDGIRKLVIDVFQDMWFKPIPENSQTVELMNLKVLNITAVVMSSLETGSEWFEQLLKYLFKPKEDKEDSTRVNIEPPRNLIIACKQIVNTLIRNILKNTQNALQLNASITTLDLFAKIRPQMLVEHAMTLQPYMMWKCQTQNDLHMITCVASIMELTVPLMEHPSEVFVSKIEETAVTLALKEQPKVIAGCLSCLGAIVNTVTQNYKLIGEFFMKCYGVITKCRGKLEQNIALSGPTHNFRPVLKRSLFIVGLILRYFNYTDAAVIQGLSPTIKDEVFEHMMYFVTVDDKDLNANALRALGSVCVRHYDFMLTSDLKTLYHDILVQRNSCLEMKIDVLRNIEVYLQEEEQRMIKQDLEWAKLRKNENLKEMHDVSSGMASTVIQVYLKEILAAFINPNPTIRLATLKVIQLVLQQGLVHPVQIVPYLICMSTDSEKKVSHSADIQLLEIEKKYPGFINMKSQSGIHLSYLLQTTIQSVECDKELVRGYRKNEVKGEYPSALNGYLYSILRNTKPQRRALVYSMLKQFEEQRTSLAHMLFLADNLAYFPYQVHDEPLYIIHQIDIQISLNGPSLLQSFREGLKPTQNQLMTAQNNQTHPNDDEDDLDDDFDDILGRLPESTEALQGYLTAAQGCLLLLFLKQHLKDIYGLSDSKISQYSPSESAKVYEKAINRRNNSMFKPTGTLNKLIKQSKDEEMQCDTINESARRSLVTQYLDFKQLVLKLDPDDPDDDNPIITSGTAPERTKASVPGTSGNTNTTLALNTTLSPSSSGVQVDPLAISSSQNPLSNVPPVRSVSKAIIYPQAQEHPQKIPPLKIVTPRRTESSRSSAQRYKQSDKSRKNRPKKRRKKFITSSGSSDQESSDPDFLA